MKKGPCVLKLGGSLITAKLRERTFRHAPTRRLAQMLVAAHRPLVLVHGTGSYGKPPARRYGYLNGLIPRKRVAVAIDVDAGLEELRRLLLSTLRNAGLPVLGLAATTLFRSRGRDIRLCDITPVRQLAARGIIPVISGGFIVDETGGLAVCSSDVIAAHLARALDASRLIFATDKAGVISGKGRDRRVLSILHETAARTIAARCRGDVSGGMRGKLEAGFLAASAGVRTLIVDGRSTRLVADALAGKHVQGTRLVVRDR